jgi:hypothetical protein
MVSLRLHGELVMIVFGLLQLSRVVCDEVAGQQAQVDPHQLWEREAGHSFIQDFQDQKLKTVLNLLLLDYYGHENIRSLSEKKLSVSFQGCLALTVF